RPWREQSAGEEHFGRPGSDVDHVAGTKDQLLRPDRQWLPGPPAKGGAGRLPRGPVPRQLRWLFVRPPLVGAPGGHTPPRGFCPRQPAGSRQSIEQVILVGRQVEREASSLTRLGNKGAAARAGAESAGSTERGPTSVLAQDQYVILSRLEQSHDDPRRF